MRPACVHEYDFSHSLSIKTKPTHLDQATGGRDPMGPCLVRKRCGVLPLRLRREGDGGTHARCVSHARVLSEYRLSLGTTECGKAYLYL
jgi:hypothetical protein